MAKLWLCFLLVALTAVLSNAQTQDLEQRLDPVHQSELSNDALDGDGERGDRDKRFGILKKIGLKAGLIDFVFGKIDSFIDSKTRFINELDKQNIYKNEKYYGITYPPKTDPHNNLFFHKPSYPTPSYPRPSTSTGPPPVDFQVNSAVSLVIPDRLYGNSFTLVTNASKILGDVIYNTADRAQEFADVVNHKLQTKFAFAKKIIKFAQPILKLKGHGGFYSSSVPSSSSSSVPSSSSSSGSSSSSSSFSSSSSNRSAISSASSSNSNTINLLTKRKADTS